MSKKKQKPILSDKIAELIAPRRLLDPEIDSEDETAARAIDYELDEELGETNPVPLSDIRRKNIKLLHDVNAKYSGRKSSRKELESGLDSNEGEESASDDDDNNGIDMDDSSEPEIESNEKSIGEFSMMLTPKQRIKLVQEADDKVDESSAEENATSSEDEENIKSFSMKLVNSSKSEVDVSTRADFDWNILIVQ